MWTRLLPALMLGALLLAAGGPAALAHGEEVSVTPSRAAVGQTIAIKGTGFKAGGEVTIGFAGEDHALGHATVAVLLPILWALVLALHLARPYMLQNLQKFTLRLGADRWWLTYRGARDLLVVITLMLTVSSSCRTWPRWWPCRSPARWRGLPSSRPSSSSSPATAMRSTAPS